MKMTARALSEAILDQSRLFWTCPNMFLRFQNVEDQSKNNFLTYFISHFEHVMSKTIWTCSKQFGQVQNYFGLLKGQGISSISNLKVAKVGKMNALSLEIQM